MNLKMFRMIFGSAFFGFCVAIALANLNYKKQPIWGFLGIAGLSGTVAGLVATNSAGIRNSELREKLEKSLREEFCACTSKKNHEISELTREIELTRSGYRELQNECKELQQAFASIKLMFDRANSEKEAAINSKEELQATIAAWERHFNTRVVAEAETQFKAAKTKEIERIFSEHDAITSEAMGLFERLQNWSEKVQDGHTSKAAIIRGLANSYNQNLDEVGNAIEEERGAYLNQIELLNMRVARLQQEVAGEILEPRLYRGGYSIEANIANDILRLLFSRFQLALACEGIKSVGGDTTIGLGYSVGADPQKLIEAINGYVPDLKRDLGLAELGLAKKLDYADILTMSFRREPRAQRTKIERLAEFDFSKIAKKIILSLETKPTLRITGATGDGKGVAARAIINALCAEVEGWVIRLHDPQHGSQEDHWGISKVSKSGEQLKENLALCVEQMESRERGVNMSITTLDIFDEVDTQLEKEDKDNFPIMLSRMRHLNMKGCIVGQNVKVGRAGLQWSDMGQVVACYMGSGCLDVIDAHPHLKKKSAELSEQYYELSEWCEFENRKLPIESRYLFGLLVIPGNKPQWFILPPANQIVVDAGSNTIATSMRLTNSNYAPKTTDNVASKLNKSTANCQFSESNSSVETPTVSMSAQGGKTPLGGVGSILTPLSAETALPSCKHHPDAQLSVCSDGRYYCPQCKRKLPKKDLK